jgi:hypothetical protein
MVSGLGMSCTSFPAALLAATSAALLLPDGSAATMVMLGLMDLAASVMPDSMPPPLTGTTLQQRHDRDWFTATSRTLCPGPHAYAAMSAGVLNMSEEHQPKREVQQVQQVLG